MLINFLFYLHIIIGLIESWLIVIFFQSMDSMSCEVNIKKENVTCKYCSNPVVLLTSDWLKCNDCEDIIHSSCLKRLSTPGGLQSDVFFQFTCFYCSPDGSEILIREKLSWFKIVVLVLHHLHFRAYGTAKNGYFHWRIHLMKFIEKNWDILFPKTL